MLSGAQLRQALAAEAGAYRERFYPPLQTLALFLEQVLESDQACQDAVARHLSERTALGLAPCSLNTGPYCKARGRLALGLIRCLQRQVASNLEGVQPLAWKWHGREVKLLDGTTVSMPDTRSNQALYPQSAEQAPGLGFPLARVVGVIALGHGALLDWAMGPGVGKGTGEQALLRQIEGCLHAGDIALADRYFCTYFTLARLQQKGVDVVMRQHAHRKVDFRAGRRLGPRDHVVLWHKPQRPDWMDEPTYAQMPEALTVRECKVRGRVLVSTLLDAQRVTTVELDALYQSRWHIELDLRSIKAVMQMDILRCKTPAMVQKEVAAHLLGYNLVRALMARAARLADVLPRALSFKGALQVVRAFSEVLRLNPAARLSVMLAHLLGAIASLRLAQRPNRVEPRAVKRRPKPHRLLTVPRSVARAQLVDRYEAMGLR